MRVAVGADPVTGRTLQRSFCFHGDADAVDAYRCELAAAYAEQRGVRTVAPFITVGDLLERWLAVEHWWMPSTIVGYRSTVKALVASPLADVRVLSLSPQKLRTVLSAWKDQGASVSTVGARYRVVRSALAWAFEERIIDRNPLEGMRGGPPRPDPRRDIPFEDVRRLLAHADAAVARAAAVEWMTGQDRRRLHRAEQTRLLVRLAADSGARRGELAALRLDDLDGAVLTIERGTSMEEVGPTKSKRSRRLTLGSGTVELWRSSVAVWEGRLAPPARFGPWLFGADLAHNRRLTTSALAHGFAELCGDSGMSGLMLHRLRHSVATLLVRRGDLLDAQARLGHRDASTTLRNYVHALPLGDAAAADAIDAALRSPAAAGRAGADDQAL